MLLLGHASACSQWQRLPGRVEDNVAAPSIHRARLVMRDGSAIILRDAVIRQDSVVGRNVQTYERRAVPTVDVYYVDSRIGWTQRTAGGIAGLAVVGLISAFIVVFTARVFTSAAPPPTAQ